jgi:hypothetical protein
MGLWFVQYACVDLEWSYIATFVHMWFVCVSLILVLSKKINLFISVYNVDNWIIFVKNSILKSPIIIVTQCEGIFV